MKPTLLLTALFKRQIFGHMDRMPATEVDDP